MDRGVQCVGCKVDDNLTRQGLQGLRVKTSKRNFMLLEMSYWPVVQIGVKGPTVRLDAEFAQHQSECELC